MQGYPLLVAEGTRTRNEATLPRSGQFHRVSAASVGCAWADRASSYIDMVAMSIATRTKGNTGTRRDRVGRSPS